MNEHKDFSRKSFLHRFVISQFLLSAVVFGIISVASQHPRRQVKTDAEKIASKVISAKTTTSALK